MLPPVQATLIALILLLFLTVGYALGYNRLIRLRNRVVEGWSGIDVQLKRRHELIPNLIKIVQAYQQHERTLLEEVTVQRGQAELAHTVADAARAEEELGRGLDRVLLLAEDYPDLKADENFRDLMKELVATEDAIQYARRYYNGSVRDLNNGLESFPSNLIGKLAAFRKAEFFEISQAAEREVVILKT